jgi:hypothetical protein
VEEYPFFDLGRDTLFIEVRKNSSQQREKENTSQLPNGANWIFEFDYRDPKYFADDDFNQLTKPIV